MAKTRAAHFCPMCGTALESHLQFGLMRPTCPACGHIVFFAPSVAVVAFVRDGDQVLLVQRAREPKQGFWALPAGFMEWNEDPQAAACREVLEETGLSVEITRLLDVFHTPDDGGMADIVIAYQVRVVSGVAAAADDAAALGRFGLGELPPLAFLPTERLLSRWRAGAL